MTDPVAEAVRRILWPTKPKPLPPYSLRPPEWVRDYGARLVIRDYLRQEKAEPEET